jgi:succinyl-CoA synthetase alpha subunit
LYIDEKSRIVVQGITGNQGLFHTRLMIDYGTKIVAGVTPGKGGRDVYGIPVYNIVRDAVNEQNANTSIIFVPAKFAYHAVLESLEAGITITCVITENIPILDMLRLIEFAQKKKLYILGPNTPGMLIPDKIKLGIMPGDLCHFGNVAIISKSGTLSYEVTKVIGAAGIGVSAYIGIGGDPIRGITMQEAVKYYSEDSNTKIIVIIGEIGGDEEEKTARYIKEFVSKPVIAYIAGKNAPKGKRMGHAGAIISGVSDTVETKLKSLKKAGAIIADVPWDIPKLINSTL